jgi:hypothetical protein
LRGYRGQGQVTRAARRHFAAAAQRIDEHVVGFRDRVTELLANPKLPKRASERLAKELAAAREEIDAIATRVQNVNHDGWEVRGTISISARKDARGHLTHWIVRADNDGAQAWIATVSFAKTYKTAGRGLDSMAVPERDSSATQRIDYNGNYGTRARPASMVRIGVRGHSYLEVPLPASGRRTYSVRDFLVGSDDGSDSYFKKREVRAKRVEKTNEDTKVRFYDRGKLWRKPED